MSEAVRTMNIQEAHDLLYKYAEKLEAENSELLKDRERLEWMIKNEASVYWVDDCAYSVNWDGENVMHHNWRDAIDEAMRGE